jgi:transposase-like protein
MGKSCRPSAAELEKLQRWIAAHGTPQQVALRCRIVVAAASGRSDVAIAEQLSVNRNTVILWRRRFGEGGPYSLWAIKPGRGRKPRSSNEKIADITGATENRTSGNAAPELPDPGTVPVPPGPKSGRRKSVAA